MIRLHEIKLRAGESESRLPGKVERRLGLPKGSILGVRIVKESLDAREKPDVYRVFSLDVESDLPDHTLLLAAKNKKMKAAEVNEQPYVSPEMTREMKHRPVVVGFGPCGIFAALTLANYGLKPIVIERGAMMEQRIEAVENFWNGGKLDPNANVQFGEGGAGTFSDGKLTTGTKDAAQRIVLEAFVDAGASPAILYRQKPHIGTDVIRRAVVEIRRKLLAMGTQFRFNTTMKSVEIEDGAVKGVIVRTGFADELIETDTVILALGHSSRDSFAMLNEKGLKMEQKQFSMGVRIEHPQKMIDMAQYGALSSDLGIGPADYKLAVRTAEGRGVYTFCMCPGGYVVASASGEGQVVTNGMSESLRDGENSNSALLVDVLTSDFGGDDPLAGVRFQEKYEHLAFEAGGGNYKAPAQKVGDFLGKEITKPCGGPVPTYRPGVTWTELDKCLPDFVANSIREALPMLERKMHGFAAPDAVMTAIESRSSSPVRIRRGPDGCALTADGGTIRGLFPAGEGAGYAGGIMSSAVDGIHAAEHAATI